MSIASSIYTMSYRSEYGIEICSCIVLMIYIYTHMQTYAGIIFQGFLKELSRTTPRAYFNSKKVIQSSVGMIFKVYGGEVVTKEEDVARLAFDRIELLFTQRAGYEGDRNAFNIVFPGGQCDEGQSDLQACKRELFEEVGLKVDEQCLYLGQLPSNFYYLGKRGKDVYITCHVWCMKQDHQKWKQTLNAAQLCDSRWVNLTQLLTGSNYLVQKSLRLGILQRIASKYKLRIISDVSKQVDSISTPQLNLGMKRNLWGLTLWLWSYALQMACANIIRSGQEKKVEEAKGWVRQMENLEVKFKEGFILKYPALAVIKSWHYFNRVRPFHYNPSPLTYKLALLIILFVGIVISLLL